MTPSARLTLHTPGLYSLVVDHGRPRTRSLGVSVGGAADRFALALGNALVGNPLDTPALEITLAGPILSTSAPVACVLQGAPFEVRLAGARIEPGTTFTLPPDERLEIGGTPTGMRAYLCLQGGIDAPVILGSRSSFTPLPAGTVLTCRSGTIGRRRIAQPFEPAEVLRVLPGTQADWFPPGVLAGRVFTVRPASNRMGVRLAGEPLPVPPREMVSEPVCPGSVQVTRDGQCIVLGIDGQTIGGYPKIAQVIAADLDRLGQVRPGTTIRFEAITLDEAEALYRDRQRRLEQWLTRLRLTAGTGCPTDGA